MQPETRYVPCLSPLGFHRMAYYEWGQATVARTIVCAHGLTRNGRDFDELAKALAATGHVRVVCIDVVGRGRSDWLKDPALYAYQQYMSDMNTLLARLNTDAIDWIGTSMGGLIGILLAAQANNPIKRLVLNDVGPYIPLAALQRIAGYVGLDPVFSGKPALEAFLRKNYAVSGPLTDADFTHLVEHSHRVLPDGRLGLAYDAAIAKNFATLTADVDLWPFYDRITVPSLVIHGTISDVLTHDTAVEMTQRGPKAQLVEIPGIGHIPTLTDQHQIRLIQSFLQL